MKLFLTVVSFFSFSFVFAQTGAEYYKKADAHFDKKEYDKALEQVNLALQTDSLNREYLLLKGVALEYLGKYQESYNTFTGLINQYPTDAIALNTRALLLLRIQEFEIAIQDFDKALGFMNSDSLRLSLYLNRSAAKSSIRDFQGAYEDLSAAYQIDSNDIGTLNNLAAVCDEVGKGDLTLRYLFRIIKIDSTFIGAYSNIGFKYQGMGQHKKAIQYFDKVLKLSPNEPLGFSNRAFSKLKLGDIKGATQDINKSIELYPANSYAFKIRAQVYLAQKKTAEACKDIEEALKLGFTKMYGNEVEELKAKNCK